MVFALNSSSAAVVWRQEVLDVRRDGISEAI